MLKQPNQSGQTLLESLMAIAIILIGVVSLASLLVNLWSTSSRALAETRATQLGQEAIEAARYVRDSNWLKREAGITDSATSNLLGYNTGLYGKTVTDNVDYSAIYIWTPSEVDPNLAIKFDFSVDNESDARAIVRQDTAGNYLQISGNDFIGLTATPFKRLVTLFPICFNPNEPDLTQAEIVRAEALTCVDGGYIDIGVQVMVQVIWQQAGEQQERIFTEKLYNWKYADPIITK
ncbi:MAG: type II secretion system protein [Patescibacteria group bacterium]|jgi:Tfp pilus assembly protein PilV